MKTLVLGASSKTFRYSYLAVKMLQEYEHDVVALGRRQEQVEDWEILEGKPILKGIETITVYLNAANQKQYYEYILSLNPKRVIFNPGAENLELEEILKSNNIEPIQACTLVMLRTNQY
jgi:hypothetical protein